MKRLLKHLVWVAAILVAVTCITACSKWGTPYESMDKDGFNVSVRFDSNGGMFAGANDVCVVDVFNLETITTNSEGTKEITLISPDDKDRGKHAFEISKNGCFLAGWYTERTPILDANGVHLNYYGQPASDTEQDHAYTYSGKWDFDTDKVVLDPNGDYTSSQNVLTLYAAWVPYYNFEFYAQGADGEFELVKTQNGLELTVPTWNTETGKLDSGKFPTLDGKTFEGAYYDAAMTQAISGTITGSVNYETGTSNNLEPIKIYTTWREGTWFKIYNAKQFVANSRLDGCYELMADLDFTGLNWSAALSKGEFKGQILGGGHKMSNITVLQGDTRQKVGGIFGKLANEAVLSNVTFENATYSIERGSIDPNAEFGLLAGNIAADATLTNLTISGKIQIGSRVNADTNPANIGLLCSSGTFGGIDSSNIACVAAEGNESVNIEVNDGIVTLTFVS